MKVKLSPGAIVHNFSVIHYLGHGQNGTAFKVQKNGQNYAMKVWNDPSNTDFHVEKRLGYLIDRNGIPNLTAAYHYFEQNPRAIVFQLGQKATIRLGEMSGNFSAICDGVLELSKGLLLLHSVWNVSHNDIADRNVILLNNELSLCDLGMANISEDEHPIMQEQLEKGKQMDVRQLVDFMLDLLVGRYPYNQIVNSKSGENELKRRLEYIVCDKKLIQNLYLHGSAAWKAERIVQDFFDLPTLRAILFTVKHREFDRNAFPNRPSVREHFRAIYPELNPAALMANKSMFIHIPVGSNGGNFITPVYHRGGFFHVVERKAGANETITERKQLFKGVYCLLDLLNTGADESFEAK